MANEQDDITDMTRGVYRRQYAGFVGGKRINRLTLEAEAWFWRVHAAADDYGNLVGERSMLYTATAGRRAGQVTIDQVGGWVGEMLRVDLLRKYEVAGECHLHVVDFELMQPKNRSGRRVHRVPASPWDGGGNGPAFGQGADAAGTDDENARKNRGGVVVGSPGESGGIRGHHSNNHDHDRLPPAGEAGGPAAAARPGPASPPPPPDEIVLTFPCVGKPHEWPLRASAVARFAELYPALNILAECRSALAYVEGRPRNRKTATGMPAYLTSWLTRSVNTPRMRAKPDEAPAAPRSSRQADRMTEIEEALK